jgi:hypothetical protein
MVVGVVGGWLFDNWKPVGPFLYMAGSNAFMVMAAVLVFFATRRARGDQAGKPVAAGA